MDVNKENEYKHICEKCENVANQFKYCNNCFISDF